jgi:Heavy metal associated domain 2
MSGIHVAHDIPGRLRLRLPPFARVEGLREAVASQPGVTEYTWSPRTGSILLRYRPETATAAGLVESVARHTGLEGPPEAPGGPDRARPGVAAVFGELDRRVRRVTGDRTGLGGLVPLALTVWAVSEIVRGRVAPLPWSSALWYAHGLFRDYNLTPGE